MGINTVQIIAENKIFQVEVVRKEVRNFPLFRKGASS